MKIGILLISGNFAGAERSVRNLVKNFKKNKTKVTLFLNKEILKYYSDLKGIKIINLGEFLTKNKFQFAQSIIRLSKRFKEEALKRKLDIIYPSLEISLIIFYNFYKKNKLPFLITLRGGEIRNFTSSNNPLYRIFIKNKIKFLLKKSVSIGSLSLWQTKELDKELKNKIIIIPNGIESNIFKPLENIKKKKNVVLFTGRFIDWKGIYEIIDVAKQLPQYEFWFAGQGPLANLINLPNTKNLGFKKTEGLVKLYNQSTICIFPSWHEPFGNVGLEAMSCRKAVIATPLGFSEYIENGKDGIIIQAKNEKALKDAIIKLMANEKLRKKLERNARKKASQYSWDKIAKQYLKVFKEIIRNKR